MSTCRVDRVDYGVDVSGAAVYEYTLRVPSGMSVSFISRGVTITHVKTADINGHYADVVLGHNDLAKWIQHGRYFNSIIGRYANRIKAGQFTLDGKSYRLECNNGPNHLHGGSTGYDTRVFTEIHRTETAECASVTLRYVSADGEAGYPGKLTVDCTMAVYPHSDGGDELRMTFTATTDKPTIVNICNHAYWNLSGDYASKDILSHRLTLNADLSTPIDATMIPTGELAPVSGTHMDFTSPHAIGERIGVFTSVDRGANGGYDHNFVLKSDSTKRSPDRTSVHAATLVDDVSGRVMDVYTTAPAIQLYTGNFLDGSVVGKEGKPYVKHSALCLETQVTPNSPNVDHFPNCVLRPGETYRHVVSHVFSRIPASSASSS